MNNVYQSETHEYDNLLLMGQMPVTTDTVKVCGGNSLKRGSVIGLKEDTKEAYLVDKTKTDGTQIPYGVIVETTYSPNDYEAVVYLTGELNADELIVGSGTVDDYKQEMRKVGLFIRDVQGRY